MPYNLLVLESPPDWITLLTAAADSVSRLLSMKFLSSVLLGFSVFLRFKVRFRFFSVMRISNKFNTFYGKHQSKERQNALDLASLTRLSLDIGLFNCGILRHPDLRMMSSEIVREDKTT